MKTVLITGASSGIGREFAKIYAQNNYNLVIISRRYERMNELKEYILKNINSKLMIEIICMDLSVEGASKKLYDIIKRKNIVIDTLINNAGIGIYGEFSEYTPMEIEKNNKMINLNLKASIELTKFFLDDMLSRSCGRILNVASIAAFQAGPMMATYYASKAFILSFSEALREELKKTDIVVSVLCPGPTATEFEKSSDLTETGLFSKMKVMSAEKVAKIAYRDFSKGKRIIIPGIINKLTVFGTKIVPRVVATKIAGKLQEKKK